jgi:acyl-CoA thioester hydrolase
MRLFLLGIFPSFSRSRTSVTLSVFSTVSVCQKPPESGLIGIDGVAGKSDDNDPAAPMNFPMNGSQCIPLDGEIHDGRHFLTVRVSYEDTDFTGVVYHANFLRYMERGRTNHLRLIAADHRALLEATEHEAPGFAFVVRSMTLDFLRPARMDDVLEIVTEPEAVKGASIVLHQRVMRGDEILVEASVRVAFVSGGRARPIPNTLRIAMGADQEPRS